MRKTIEEDGGLMSDPDAMRLMASFMKSEVLRLLSERPMTETTLQGAGSNKGSVGQLPLEFSDRGSANA